MFEKESEYYYAHKKELLQRYEGRWLVIVGSSIEGDFQTPEGGFYYGLAKFGEGNFMLKECVENDCIIIRNIVFRNENVTHRQLLQ